MKNYIILFWFCFTANLLYSQTTIIGAANNGNFENATPSLNWNIVNPPARALWYIGTTSKCSGTNGAYVGTAAGNNSYDNGYSRICHLYRDVTFPAGETSITLTFDWKGQGESSFDGLKVFLGSTLVAPVANTTFTISDGSAVQLGNTWYNLQGTCVTATITIPATNAGTTKRLVFSWHQDASSGSNPAVTVDNISLISSPPPPAPSNDLCANATNLPCGTTNLAGTTVNTTNVASPAGCASNYGVWYTFVGDGQSTIISSTATFDHEMVISSGSCGSLTNIVCDDGAGSGGTETHTFTTTNGVTYYVYIAHYSTSSTITGTFTISRTCCTVPVVPTAAAAIPSQYQIVFNWNAVAGATSYSVGTTTNYASASNIGNLLTYTSTGLNCNTSYNLYVWANNACGNSTMLTIPATTLACPPPPSNDLCANATSLPCGTSNLAGSTVSTTNVAHSTGCFLSNYGVWYSFVGDGQNTTISATGVNLDIEMAIVSGSCGSLTNIACLDNSWSSTGTEIYTFLTNPATTYYIYRGQ